MEKIIGNIRDNILSNWRTFYHIYGILGASALIAVPVKFIVFYMLMGITTGFVPAFLVSLLITYLLFKIFDDKLIPAVLFCVMSVLMFCDVTYNSFFNRYLSVGMLGAAGVLGDITESIKVVMRPVNFVMLIDPGLALAAVLKVRKREHGAIAANEETGDRETEASCEIEEVGGSVNETACEIEEADRVVEAACEIQAIGERIYAEFDETEKTESQETESIRETGKEDKKLGNECAAHDIDCKYTEEGRDQDLNDMQVETEFDVNEEALNLEDDTAHIYGRNAGRVRAAVRKRRQKLLKLRHAIVCSPILLIAILLLGSLAGIGACQSITNQEFYTFHIKDVFGTVFKGQNGNLAAWTDDYQTEKNGPLFGVAEGKNLVVIQMESLQNFVIGREYNGQEITPNLNKLLEGNTTYFDNFYQQIGSGNTSDAEFAANNSIYGSLTSYTYNLFDENCFRGLPVLLKERGYNTAVFHAAQDRTFWNREDMYPTEGFDRYYGGLTSEGGDYDMTEWMGWGLTDSEFFKQTVGYMKEIQEPYYNFIITISNHHPYQMLKKYRFIKLLPEDRETIVGNYLQSAAYTDYSIGLFIDRLKKEGLYDNTVFVLYGDHAGLTHSDEIDESMERLLGRSYDFRDMMRVPLIIHMPDDSHDIHQVISTAGGQTDILPTLAYLFGFDKLDTLYVGHNLYTVKNGLVAEQTFMTKGSFFSNDIAYEMARDGIFENGRAWNIHTGEPVDVASCYEDHLKAVQIIETSEYALRSDAIRRIFLDGGKASDIADLKLSRIYPDEIVAAGYPDKSLAGKGSEKALNYSVYAGYKDIMLDIDWDADGKPYAVNTNTGRKAMTGDEIASWMATHGNVNLYFNVKENGDALIQYLAEKNKTIVERAVPIIPSQEEYSGKYEAVLNLSAADISAKQVKKLIAKKDLRAVVVREADLRSAYSSILKEDIQVYVEDAKVSIMKKAEDL